MFVWYMAACSSHVQLDISLVRCAQLVRHQVEQIPYLRAPMYCRVFIKGVWWSPNTNKADLWLIRLLFTYLQITAPQIWNLIFCYVFNCLSLIFWYSSISLGKCFDSSSTSSDLKFCKVKEETFRYYLC